MKLGFVTSTALHAGLLAWGLVVIQAPPALETAAVEALPVDIVPIEEFTRAVAGSQEAPKLDAPAPEPIDWPKPENEGVNVGEAEIDIATRPAPATKPVPVDAAEPVTSPDPVLDATEVADVPAPTARPEPASVPTTEVAAAPEPPTPVVTEPEPVRAPEPTELATPTPAETVPTPEPVETAALPPDDGGEALPAPVAEPEPPMVEAEPEEPAEPQFAALPASGPSIASRPPARVARTPDRREDPPQETASRSEEGERNLSDDIRAVSNRETASGGGTKRPTQKASLGTSRGSDAALSRSEMDALKQAMSRCWSPPAGVADAATLVVKLRMRLLPDGTLDGRPEVVDAPATAAGRAATGAASRAMLRCAPYALPADKYDTWSEVIVNFDPREMF